MNTKTKISIIVGAVVLLIVLLYFFGRSNNVYVTDDWSESYNPEEKEPYGTYMLKELLDTAGLFGDFIEIEDELEDELEDDEDVNDIYFFVGKENHLKKRSVEHLLNFVDDGNTAFIATRKFPRELLREICEDRYAFYEKPVIEDTIQYFKFHHSHLKNQRFEFKYIKENKVDEKEWVYMDESSLIEDEYQYPISLGSNVKEKVNFIRIIYGDGSIFLHSNPYLFSYLCLMRRDGFRYAEKVLEHIPPGRVQWDKDNLKSQRNENSGGDNRRSMLEFLFMHPTLIWALIILLIGALLYILFKGKRMQNIIPAAESKENTSMRYINTLSSLYMQEAKHNKLIQLKERTFINFIAEKYYISTNKADIKYIEKVAQKSQVSKDELIEIFNLFKNLNQVELVSDESLILLHKKIETFYKKCR